MWKYFSLNNEKALHSDKWESTSVWTAWKHFSLTNEKALQSDQWESTSIWPMWRHLGLTNEKALHPGQWRNISIWPMWRHVSLTNGRNHSQLRICVSGMSPKICGFAISSLIIPMIISWHAWVEISFSEVSQRNMYFSKILVKSSVLYWFSNDKSLRRNDCHV
jgi:hypothetical protein